jgi:hypothetical protein
MPRPGALLLTLSVSILGGCTPGSFSERAVPEAASATDSRPAADSGAILADRTIVRLPDATPVSPREAGAPAMDQGAPATDQSVPVTSPIGPNGGTVSLLSFAVFGDTRTTDVDMPAEFPTPIVTSIMQGIQTLGPPLTIAMGDYTNVDDLTDANTEIDDLLSAESGYHGFVAYIMGNHECGGSASTNCPTGSETPASQVFMSRLIPFSSTPYYYFVVHTSLGDAKFIQIAANAWTQTQSDWLTATLAIPSTYTFVSRHEEPGDTKSPGAAPSDSILAAASPPPTLELYSHKHYYQYLGGNQVISGNGGAPLDCFPYYGYLYVTQRADGNIAVTEYQQGTNSPTESWAVTPAGAPTN